MQNDFQIQTCVSLAIQNIYKQTKDSKKSLSLIRLFIDNQQFLNNVEEIDNILYELSMMLKTRPESNSEDPNSISINFITFETVLNYIDVCLKNLKPEQHDISLCLGCFLCLVQLIQNFNENSWLNFSEEILIFLLNFLNFSSNIHSFTENNDEIDMDLIQLIPRYIIGIFQRFFIQLNRFDLSNSTKIIIVTNVFEFYEKFLKINLEFLLYCCPGIISLVTLSLMKAYRIQKKSKSVTVRLLIFWCDIVGFFFSKEHYEAYNKYLTGYILRHDGKEPISERDQRSFEIRLKEGIKVGNNFKWFSYFDDALANGLPLLEKITNDMNFIPDVLEMLDNVNFEMIDLFNKSKLLLHSFLEPLQQFAIEIMIHCKINNININTNIATNTFKKLLENSKYCKSSKSLIKRLEKLIQYIDVNDIFLIPKTKPFEQSFFDLLIRIIIKDVVIESGMNELKTKTFFSSSSSFHSSGYQPISIVDPLTCLPFDETLIPNCHSILKCIRCLANRLFSTVNSVEYTLASTIFFNVLTKTLVDADSNVFVGILLICSGILQGISHQDNRLKILIGEVVESIKNAIEQKKMIFNIWFIDVFCHFCIVAFDKYSILTINKCFPILMNILGQGKYDGYVMKVFAILAYLDNHKTVNSFFCKYIDIIMLPLTNQLKYLRVQKEKSSNEQIQWIIYGFCDFLRMIRKEEFALVDTKLINILSEIISETTSQIVFNPTYILVFIDIITYSIEILIKTYDIQPIDVETRRIKEETEGIVNNEDEDIYNETYLIHKPLTTIISTVIQVFMPYWAADDLLLANKSLKLFSTCVHILSHAAPTVLLPQISQIWNAFILRLNDDRKEIIMVVLRSLNMIMLCCGTFILDTNRFQTDILNKLANFITPLSVWTLDQHVTKIIVHIVQTTVNNERMFFFISQKIDLLNDFKALITHVRRQKDLEKTIINDMDMLILNDAFQMFSRVKASEKNDSLENEEIEEVDCDDHDFS
eukprot:TRINITY_DN901_c0_g1_i1.p1 TRINITY_DN901_c0_g1~~TRINITY_DN901_c0_g1_i1.p1  ORF type:complete len:987 (-),score=255.00 TRINITY_DN901_c0_g1_i1:146-3106(-)